MADAFIKLHRKMLDWEWYDDVNTCRVFIHCLLKANWKSGSWHGISYDPGQFITSLPTLAVETHLSIQQVRTALAHLKSTGEITDYQQANYRVITVKSWYEYQGDNRQSNRRSTDNQQAVNRQSTADKEYKEYKEREEGKEVKNLYYPNDEKLDKAFADYVDYRKKIKKPLTDRGIELTIKRLEKLSGGDNDKSIRIIEQSIVQGWQGLFELHEAKENKPQSLYDKWMNA